MPQQISDRQSEYLLVRCKLGEHDAFVELVGLFDARIHAYVSRMLRGEQSIDDIRQDVWVRIIRGIGRLRDHRRLEAWVFVVARRTVMDVLRKRYRSIETRELLESQSPVDAWDPASDERLAALSGTVERLPPTERDAITLFYLFDRSIAAVARIQGVPEGTVKSRLARGRGRLLSFNQIANEETHDEQHHPRPAAIDNHH